MYDYGLFKFESKQDLFDKAIKFWNRHRPNAPFSSVSDICSLSEMSQKNHASNG